MVHKEDTKKMSQNYQIPSPVHLQRSPWDKIKYSSRGKYTRLEQEFSWDQNPNCCFNSPILDLLTFTWLPSLRIIT